MKNKAISFPLILIGCLYLSQSLKATTIQVQCPSITAKELNTSETYEYDEGSGKLTIHFGKKDKFFINGVWDVATVFKGIEKTGGKNSPYLFQVELMKSEIDGRGNGECVYRFGFVGLQKKGEPLKPKQLLNVQVTAEVYGPTLGQPMKSCKVLTEE